jgi:hypothetical protein
MMQNIGAGIAPRAFGEPHFAKTVEEAREILKQECSVNYP